jgi:hypothetical protein
LRSSGVQWSRLWILAIVFMAIGCRELTIKDGALPCSRQKHCPSPFTCRLDGFCHLYGDAGGAPDGPDGDRAVPDGALDDDAYDSARPGPDGPDGATPGSDGFDGATPDSVDDVSVKSDASEAGDLTVDKSESCNDTDCSGHFACVGGECSTTVCAIGYSFCDGACITFDTPQNCGACGATCDHFTNVSLASCRSGQCAIVQCAPLFLDCDGRAIDGCEIHAATCPP